MAGHPSDQDKSGMVPQPSGPDAFRLFFDAHVSYVSASLARLGVREADRDDLTSEVFVRVHPKLSTFDTTRPARPWLFAFAARVVSEHRRLARHRHEVLGVEEEPASESPNPEEALSVDQTRALVLAGLEHVDFDRRTVLVLHDLDDVAVPEIARALGIPEGTAYTRLRAGRAELAAAITRLRAVRRRP